MINGKERSTEQRRCHHEIFHCLAVCLCVCEWLILYAAGGKGTIYNGTHRRCVCDSPSLSGRAGGKNGRKPHPNSFPAHNKPSPGGERFCAYDVCVHCVAYTHASYRSNASGGATVRFCRDTSTRRGKTHTHTHPSRKDKVGAVNAF